MLKFIKRFFTTKKQDNYILEGIYAQLQLYPRVSELHFIRALTHSSYTKNIDDKNERLEFLGDAVINFCVGEFLFYKMERKDEGVLTKARASIVNRKNLNKIGLEIGIDKFLRHKLTKAQLVAAPDIIGNAFEALIGAYYLEYDMPQMRLLLSRLILNDFDAQNFHKSITDPKSYLLEWAQAKKKQVVFLHNTTSSETMTNFFVSLKIDEEIKSSGIGKNKKEAELMACQTAIKLMELDL